MNLRSRSLAFVITVLLTLGANAPGARADVVSPSSTDPVFDTDLESSENVYDPFERLNRRTFAFNDRLYTVALRPTARAYEKVVPGSVRTGLGNAYRNAQYPVRLVGSLLQGKVRRSFDETTKFLVNTVGGAAGWFEPSRKFPRLAALPAEDIGQALGSWGIGHGPYLVLPLLGGASLRDSLGGIGDSAVSPTSWRNLGTGGRGIAPSLNWEWRTALVATETLNALPATVRTYDFVRDSALDPYLAVRDATRAHRDRETAR